MYTMLFFLLADRTSLKFAQEVQEAKAMDDLMGKIDKLMTGSPDAEHTGYQALCTPPPPLPFKIKFRIKIQEKS